MLCFQIFSFLDLQLFLYRTAFGETGVWRRFQNKIYFSANFESVSSSQGGASPAFLLNLFSRLQTRKNKNDS